MTAERMDTEQFEVTMALVFAGLERSELEQVATDMLGALVAMARSMDAASCALQTGAEQAHHVLSIAHPVP